MTAIFYFPEVLRVLRITTKMIAEGLACKVLLRRDLPVSVRLGFDFTSVFTVGISFVQPFHRKVELLRTE